MSVLLLILGILLFIGLVVIHEFGHFMVARRNDVEVEEFGIGFPPKAWSRKTKEGWLFSLNVLPLGGFVKLKGEHDADKSPGSFGAASVWAKSKIMLAGVGLNLLVALLLFTIVALIGMPRLITKDSVGENQFTVARDTKLVKDLDNKGVVKIDHIADKSPAKAANLQPGDQIISVAGQTVASPGELVNATATNAGKKVVIELRRGDKQFSEPITLSRDTPHLGVSAYSGESGYQITRSTWSAPVVAVGLSAQLTKLTFKGLWHALQGLGNIITGTLRHNTVERQKGQEQASSQVSGPLGIFFILKEGAKQGIAFVLFIIGLISLALAIMNVLPIPALDGGRLYMMLFSRSVLGRPLTKRTEERIVGSSFVVLLLLFVLITFADVKRFL